MFIYINFYVKQLIPGGVIFYSMSSTRTSFNRRDPSLGCHPNRAPNLALKSPFRVARNGIANLLGLLLPLFLRTNLQARVAHLPQRLDCWIPTSLFTVRNIEKQKYTSVVLWISLLKFEL